MRQRKFDGATLVQTLLFGFQQHVHASLEQLASMAQVRAVSVTDSAVDKRFSEACARFLHAVLEEMSTVVVQAAQAVPLSLLKRFSAVMCEDSSTITLPDDLADLWQGCGQSSAYASRGQSAYTLGFDAGTRLGTEADGRTHLRLEQSLERRAAGSQHALHRGPGLLQSAAFRGTTGGGKLHAQSSLKQAPPLFTPEGEALCWSSCRPEQVGQLKELMVLVGARKRYPMRLLLLRVPKAVGDKRRKDLVEDAKRRGQTVSEQTLRLADWTILVTDVSKDVLRFEEALVFAARALADGTAVQAVGTARAGGRVAYP